MSIFRNLTIRNPPNTKFTLDSFESQFMVSYNLTNLSILMDNTDASNKLRRFILRFSVLLKKYQIIN